VPAEIKHVGAASKALPGVYRTAPPALFAPRRFAALPGLPLNWQFGKKGSIAPNPGRRFQNALTVFGCPIGRRFAVPYFLSSQDASSQQEKAANAITPYPHGHNPFIKQ
jgi:hypothetical protein